MTHADPARTTTPPDQQDLPDLAVLRQISQRALWLATAVVDAANRGRPNDTGIKVGGHQSSSASMVDIMVALWFHELTALDRVSVKPHARRCCTR
jgi:pyruvate dehydrogenase E1 component